MNIYQILEKEHELVLDLADQLVEAQDSKARSELINQITDELVPHSRAEEWVLYNVLRDLDQAKDVVSHSYGEHVKAEALLRGLSVSEAVHLNWKSGAEKFRSYLQHHIKEERENVFPAAKKILSEQEAVLLGKAFEDAKSKVGSGFLASQFELVMNLMPQRFRQNFMKHLQKKEGAEKRAS